MSASRITALLASRSRNMPPALYVAAGGCVVLLALWPVAASASHMLLHVLLMSAVAPLAVMTWDHLRARRGRTPLWQLWLATLLQLATFLYWHSPASMTLAMHTPAVTVLMQGSLLAVACLFWWCIRGLESDRVWHAIAALLSTGKLFCLVAVLLTFAPRPLYHAMTLAEQQSAGLIMITLCPLTYVSSAIWLCWHYLLETHKRRAAAPGCGPCG